MAEMKKCPYCAEEILAEARKCRYCGEFLDSATQPTVPAAVGHGAAPARASMPAPRVRVENPHTGKDLQLLGGIVFLISFFAVMASCSERSGTPAAIGGIGALIGLVIMGIGKAQHWYDAE